MLNGCWLPQLSLIATQAHYQMLMHRSSSPYSRCHTSSSKDARITPFTLFFHDVITLKRCSQFHGSCGMCAMFEASPGVLADMIPSCYITRSITYTFGSVASITLLSSSWPSQGAQPGAAVASTHRPHLQRSLKGVPHAVRHSAAASGRLVRAARAAVAQAPAAAPGLRAARQAAARGVWPAGRPSGHGCKPAASPRRREPLQLPVAAAGPSRVRSTEAAGMHACRPAAARAAAGPMLVMHYKRTRWFLLHTSHLSQLVVKPPAHTAGPGGRCWPHMFD